MKRSPEHRAEHLIRTREAAAALVEDLAHMREVLSGTAPSRDALRRLSGTLRRILVDDRDLQNVASPRMGRVKVFAPFNDTLIKFYERYPPIFFASGGAELFDLTLRAATLHGWALNAEAIAQSPPADEVFQTVELKLDNFLSQPVLYFDETWLSRRVVIKYMTNYASGIYSKTPEERMDKIISKIRRSITYSEESGIEFHSSRLAADDPPFRYNSKELDPMLIEVLVTAKIVVDAPDVVKLETIIGEELSGIA